MPHTFLTPNSTFLPPAARYYQSTHSFWLSVDPLADKYPNLSPYAYCAGNPVRYFDGDGRDFEVADNAESHRDVLSIVEEYHRERITFEENGMVSINIDGLSEYALKQDIGLSLLYDMSVSDKKYYYETSDVALCCNSYGEKVALPIYLKDYGGVINASKYGFDSQGGHTQLPMQGFDGEVVITQNGKFSLQGRDARKNIIFHELKENYLRTDSKMNYWGAIGMGAHKTAADIEFQGWGTLGGQATYTVPNLGKEDYEKMYQRYRNY